MWFSSLRRNLKSDSTGKRKAAPGFRPRLETLEGRDMPSTLTVTNNLESGAGGEIRGSWATLTNCTLSLNSARYGGGIYVVPPYNGNTGDGSEGGVLNLSNTIVAGNNASYGGPDIYGAVLPASLPFENYRRRF